MADDDTQKDEGNGESIDYGKSQADVDKAKQKARDEDAERLAAEHE